MLNDTCGAAPWFGASLEVLKFKFKTTLGSDYKKASMLIPTHERGKHGKNLRTTNNELCNWNFKVNFYLRG